MVPEQDVSLQGAASGQVRRFPAQERVRKGPEASPQGQRDIVAHKVEQRICKRGRERGRPSFLKEVELRDELPKYRQIFEIFGGHNTDES
jgi:hypothetical protein